MQRHPSVGSPSAAASFAICSFSHTLGQGTLMSVSVFGNRFVCFKPVEQLHAWGTLNENPGLQSDTLITHNPKISSLCVPWQSCSRKAFYILAAISTPLGTTACHLFAVSQSGGGGVVVVGGGRGCEGLKKASIYNFGVARATGTDAKSCDPYRQT